MWCDFVGELLSLLLLGIYNEQQWYNELEKVREKQLSEEYEIVMFCSDIWKFHQAFSNDKFYLKSNQISGELIGLQVIKKSDYTRIIEVEGAH